MRTPGGDWRRLYSLAWIRRTIAAHGREVEARARDLLGRQVALHVALDHDVEHLVGRQRVLVRLVGRELRRRRAVDHALRDHEALAVAPVGNAIDQRLHDVLDDREPAGHVAVERGVARGHLALVARGDDDGARLVRKRHEQRAADARLQVLLGLVRGEPLEGRRELGLEGLEERVDRDLAHTSRRGSSPSRPRPRGSWPRV